MGQSKHDEALRNEKRGRTSNKRMTLQPAHQLPTSVSTKPPGEGVDPDDAQIPDDQDTDLDDAEDDETAGDEGIDDPDSQ